MPGLRHRVRIAALQILFEVDTTDHSLDVVVERRLEEEAAAVVEIGSMSWALLEWISVQPEHASWLDITACIIENWAASEELTPEAKEFLRRLVFGVWEHRGYLDQIIEEAAPSWPINQMPGVDKAILRIALYELLIEDVERTPLKAVINEAVEIAKQFGSDNSSRFVNGVLGFVANRYDGGQSKTEN